MQEQLIHDIENVEVGDIAYFEGIEKGAVVVKVDPDDSDSRLKVETPEEFKPFNLDEYTSIWLKNRYFRRATRQTLNKPVEKRLPAVRDGHGHIFETQKGTRIIYSGLLRGWMVESFLGDKRLLELLDPSQFPLKDITEEDER